ncbi:MAG: efflux RND transporter periplasmic adaptor subunit, partial [Planctomycetota bacterium]
MTRWFRRIAILLGIAAIVVVLKLTLFQPDPVAVRTVRVERGRVEETVTNLKAGTVRARRRALVAPEVGGRVVELPHRKWERIAAGDLLLRLNDKALRARVKLNEGELAVARALDEQARVRAAQAERDLNRSMELKRLGAGKIVSPELIERLQADLDGARAASLAASAQVQKGEAALALAEAELEMASLHAPFDGVIAEMRVEMGEWVTPSPAALQVPAAFDLIDLSSLYVSAPMDETDAARVRLDQEARVTIDSHAGHSFAGRVVRVAPYVLDLEEQNRTFEIEVELEDRAFAGTLLPGTSADVEVILTVREDALRLPVTTLLEGGAALVMEDGILVRRAGRTGLRNWNFAEILDG